MRNPVRENVVQHTRPISDDNGVSVGVLVSLTVLSTSPLDPDAYPAIAEAVAAVDKLAETLKRLAAVPAVAIEGTPQ